MINPERLKEIGANIISQDNLCTSLPMFIVQQKRRVYGVDSSYTDSYIWICDGEEIHDKELINKLEQDDGWCQDRENLDCKKVGYIEYWDHVSTFFTRKGAEDYLAINSHNLKSPRIYVESGWRNKEWEDVRNFLIEQGREHEICN